MENGDMVVFAKFLKDVWRYKTGEKGANLGKFDIYKAEVERNEEGKIVRARPSKEKFEWNLFYEENKDGSFLVNGYSTYPTKESYEVPIFRITFKEYALE